jgi:GNAT superfamily N-acetyltransferase
MCEKLDEKTIGSSAKLASYHLQFLAVAPGSQGKGIGKALVMSIQSQVWNPVDDTIIELRDFPPGRQTWR